MTLLHLRHGDFYLGVAPHLGAALTYFYCLRGGQRDDILRPASATALAIGDVRGMASFPLLPFCNRIRNASFECEGQRYHITANLLPSAHAIHGLGWQSPWRVQERSSNAVTLALDYVPEHGTPRWPWRFRAELEYRLDAQGLQVRTKIHNQDQTTMPFGIGHHPYFPRRQGQGCLFNAHAMWDSDDERLPTRLTTPAFLKDLAQGADLNALDLDHHFCGWDGRATLLGSTTRARLSLYADAQFSFLNVYSPKDAHFFCLEPVSQIANAFNLHRESDHIADVGANSLSPDEQAEAVWGLGFFDATA